MRVVLVWQIDKEFSEAHEAVGHRGRDAIEAHIVGRGRYVEHIRSLAVEFVQSCDQCNSSKPLKQSHVVVQPIVSNAALDYLEIDYVSLQEDRYGNKYVMTVVDHYTKKAWVFCPPPFPFFMAHLSTLNHFCKGIKLL